MKTHRQSHPIEREVRDAAWNEFPALVARGAAMGVAEVIPGISGGTIALVTGVLHRLIQAIRSVDAMAVRHLLSLRFARFFAAVHWRFLTMLFAGQLLGILFCSKLIGLPRLFREYPEPILGLFFGLVACSLVLLMRDAGRPGLGGVVAYLGGAIGGALILIGFRAETPNTAWCVALCGAAAICAWILPGISGSFVLLLLKKYDYIWEAVTFSNDLSMADNLTRIVLPFAFGATVGLALFARFLSRVFSSWPTTTMMVMNGFLLASLWAIFPFQKATFEIVASGSAKLVSTHPILPSWERVLSSRGILTVTMVCIGIAVVFGLDRLRARIQSRISV